MAANQMSGPRYVGQPNPFAVPQVGGEAQGVQYRQQPPNLGTQASSDGESHGQQPGLLNKLGGWLRGGDRTSHQVRMASRQKLDLLENVNQEKHSQWQGAELPLLEIADDEYPWKKAQLLMNWLSIIKLTS